MDRRLHLLSTFHFCSFHKGTSKKQSNWNLNRRNISEWEPTTHSLKEKECGIFRDATGTRMSGKLWKAGKIILYLDWGSGSAVKSDATLLSLVYFHLSKLVYYALHFSQHFPLPICHAVCQSEYLFPADLHSLDVKRKLCVAFHYILFTVQICFHYPLTHTKKRNRLFQRISGTYFYAYT